jgi:hypothetical protein
METDVAGLIARATDVTVLNAADGKSGARLERALIDGKPHVIKRVAYSHDWLMQAIGDTGGAAAAAWSAGLMDRLPDCIDHATVAMAVEVTDDGPALIAVMRDVSDWLVPEGDTPIPVEQHEQFMDHMAALHAAFWGWTDEVGLIGLADRYSLMVPSRIERAQAASPDAVVPPLVLDGWRRLPSRAPAMAEAIFALHADPTPLCQAVSATPVTFLHGDWKMANLGSRPDGRTVLVDWSFPGAGPPCAELAHYLALNRARMPVAKEAAIESYRGALEVRGIDTGPWWDRQLALSLLGIMCALGWEKALGDDDELHWWAAQVAAAAPLL